MTTIIPRDLNGRIPESIVDAVAKKTGYTDIERVYQLLLQIEDLSNDYIRHNPVRPFLAAKAY